MNRDFVGRKIYKKKKTNPFALFFLSFFPLPWPLSISIQSYYLAPEIHFYLAQFFSSHGSNQ